MDASGSTQRPEFSVRAEHHDGVATIHLRGELDLATVPVLADALEVAERDQSPTVVLELAELRFMDVSGLHVVADTADRVRGRGGTIVVVGVRPRVRQLFVLVRREDLLGSASPGS